MAWLYITANPLALTWIVLRSLQQHIWRPPLQRCHESPDFGECCGGRSFYLGWSRPNYRASWTKRNNRQVLEASCVAGVLCACEEACHDHHSNTPDSAGVSPSSTPVFWCLRLLLVFNWCVCLVSLIHQTLPPPQAVACLLKKYNYHYNGMNAIQL